MSKSGEREKYSTYINTNKCVSKDAISAVGDGHEQVGTLNKTVTHSEVMGLEKDSVGDNVGKNDNNNDKNTSTENTVLKEQEIMSTHDNNQAESVDSRPDDVKDGMKNNNISNNNEPVVNNNVIVNDGMKEGSVPKATSSAMKDCQKQPDDNYFDSVSNVKSQPEKERIHFKKDMNVIDSYKPEKSDTPSTSNKNKLVPRQNKIKKCIFISYSPDAGFLERRFVVETVRQLKENNLAEDIWFDKDEKNTDNPCWFSMRMEAVEKCRAAILIISDNYYSCPVSLYEAKVLLERQSMVPKSVRIFTILFRYPESIDIPKQLLYLLDSDVNLTGEHARKSAAEKTSVVVGAIMEDLEKYATMHTAPLPNTPPDSEFTGDFKKIPICQWSASGLQEWLCHLGIKEFCRQSLAEAMVDGFLLMSMTDHDMVSHLGIESRVVRKKIMQQILQTLDREHKQPNNWHLRARAQRPKPDVVYIIYDPVDVRLAQNLKADLKLKNLQVIHHDTVKLGRSKEEFLEINGSHLATASHVIVLMTEAVTSSPFVFHEVLFADWLGKKLVTAMFKNTWSNMRVALKAVLGDCPAVDFEMKMYSESLDVMEHQIKPLRHVPGVILEQSYLNKMTQGLKPLETLANSRGNAASAILTCEEEAQVFISYQWDMQTKVDEIQQLLERAGFLCWADIAMGGPPRGSSSRSIRSSTAFTLADSGSETLQGQIQRTMKACHVVVSCITPKYLQSDNCAKDLTLADTFHKPIIPLLLRYAPSENAPNYVRRILLKYTYIDLSNERLYKQNIRVLMERVRKCISTSSLT